MLFTGCTDSNSVAPSGSAGSTLSAPSLLSITPDTGTAGTTVSVTLNGTGFVAGATTVAVSGIGVTVSASSVQSASSMTATFVIDAVIAAGTRAVRVSTAGGASGTLPFTIVAGSSPAIALPTITSLRQPDGATGTNLAQILSGTNFVAGATTVAVSGSGVTVTDVVVTSSTSLSATFVVDGAAALGARNVTVTTPAGTSAPAIFTVTTPSQVSCSPGTQTVVVGAKASFSAVSGFSSFAWSAPGGTPATGPDSSTFATTYAAAGTYTVTVTRGTTATCSVTVQPLPPKIGTFTATPTTVQAGHSTTLSWTGITNATSCAIDHGVGPVPCASGSASTVPGSSVTYTLTATGAGASVTASVAVVALPHGSQTFNFSGAQQNFVVPAGVTSITVQASGGEGSVESGGTTLTGKGGSVTATVAVTPGETLAVFVGGQAPSSPIGPGGFNGGGSAPMQSPPVVNNSAGGGGGASDVRQGGSALANRVIVAGGGGGGGFKNFGGNGGAGGGLTAGAGGTVFDSSGGGGGTQTAGGAGGAIFAGITAGASGQLGIGGAGGLGNVPGGGGGGGYFGGGGAGSSTSDPTSGGGGGSSFTAPGATNVAHTMGDHSGNGVVLITW